MTDRVRHNFVATDWQLWMVRHGSMLPA